MCVAALTLTLIHYSPLTRTYSAVVVVGVLVLVGIGVALFFLVRHLAAKPGRPGYSGSTRQDWTMDEMYSTSPATL